jgi:hypothetical protein
MDVWQRLLSHSPIEWLLGEDNPSVRYLTLRDLLDKDESDSEVMTAKKAIPKSKIATTILSKQKEGGFWETRDSPYLPKYKSTYWQVMIVGQLAVDKSDVRVHEACEFVFSLQLGEGGFSSQTRQTALGEYEWMRTRTALKEKLQPEAGAWAETLVREHQYSCLTGNACAAMLRLGYDRDPRLTKALRWLVTVQNADGGWLCPYWKAHVKDTHSCFYGTICPLEAFSEIPASERSNEIQNAVERGAEFLLKHRLYKADHHSFRVINRNWTRFSFPWFYGYDVLRGLAVLTKLGYNNDDRLADALDLLIQKRRADGTWLLESSPTGRMQANLEAVGKPSKWVTLNALKVLKQLHKTENKRLREALDRI